MGNPQQQNQVPNQDVTEHEINSYFDEVQEYIKNNYDISEDDLEKHIRLEFNQQAQINQDFYNNVDVEEIAKKIVASLENGTQIDNEPEPNLLDDNEMRERRVLKYTDFLNETRGEKFASKIFTDLEVNKTVNIPTTNEDFIRSMQEQLEREKDKKFTIRKNDFSVDITRIK